MGRSLIKGLESNLKESLGTWELYKNKPLLDRLWRVIYTSDLTDPVFDVFYKIRSFYKNVKRLIEYAPLVWNHRNWDYGYILKFNEKLHKDLHKGVFDKGCHVYTKKDTIRLKTVIGLYKRLHDDNYDEWQYDHFDKKYGKSDLYFTKIEGTDTKPGGPYSVMGSTREDRMTDKQKEDYIKERRRLWKLEEYQRKQDFALLGKYIAKYSAKWWD